MHIPIFINIFIKIRSQSLASETMSLSQINFFIGMEKVQIKLNNVFMALKLTALSQVTTHQPTSNNLLVVRLCLARLYFTSEVFFLYLYDMNVFIGGVEAISPNRRTGSLVCNSWLRGVLDTCL